MNVERQDTAPLGAMTSFRMSTPDQLPSYANLSIDLHYVVMNMYQPNLQGYNPEITQNFGFFDKRTLQRITLAIDFSIVVYFIVFLVTYFIKKINNRAYYVGGIVLGIMFCQAIAILIKRKVQESLYKKLANIDFTQACINPISCILLMESEKKVSFLMSRVYNRLEIKLPKGNKYLNALALRLFILFILVIYSYFAEIAAWLLAVVFFIQLLYFAIHAYFPPHLSKEISKHQFEQALLTELGITFENMADVAQIVENRKKGEDVQLVSIASSTSKGGSSDLAQPLLMQKSTSHESDMFQSISSPPRAHVISIQNNGVHGTIIHVSNPFQVSGSISHGNALTTSFSSQDNHQLTTAHGYSLSALPSSPRQIPMSPNIMRSVTDESHSNNLSVSGFDPRASSNVSQSRPTHSPISPSNPASGLASSTRSPSNAAVSSIDSFKSNDARVHHLNSPLSPPVPHVSPTPQSALSSPHSIIRASNINRIASSQSAYAQPPPVKSGVVVRSITDIHASTSDGPHETNVGGPSVLELYPDVSMDPIRESVAVNDDDSAPRYSNLFQKEEKYN